MKKTRVRQRLLCALLAAVLLIGLVPTAAVAAELPFTDVPNNAWYKNAVTYAYENGLFNGTGATTFSPNAPMTRAMFVQVLSNKTSNFDKSTWTGKSSFSDVNKDKWYAPAVEWAYRAGLVTGVGEGKFAPEKNVTREQMAVIMYNYAQKTGNDASFDSDILSQFPDASFVSGWAKEAMQWAVTHKVVNGSDGKLKPGSAAKRCEVAQVAVNADPILENTTVEADPNVTPDPGPDDQMGLPEKYMISGFQPDLTLKNGIAWTETLTLEEYRSESSNMNRIVDNFCADGFERVGKITHPFAVIEYRCYFVMATYTNPTTGRKMYCGFVDDARNDSDFDPMVYCFCVKLDSPPTLEDIQSLITD